MDGARTRGSTRKPMKAVFENIGVFTNRQSCEPVANNSQEC
jgi:hypothetical protein